MKKIVLFLSVLSLSLVSCSDDDSPAPAQPVNQVENIITCKVNGVQRTYANDAVIVVQQFENGYILQSVIAKDEEERVFRLNFQKDTYDFSGVYLTDENGSYGSIDGDIILDVTENSPTRMVGNFSGTFYYQGENGNGNVQEATLTEGHFNVNK